MAFTTNNGLFNGQQVTVSPKFSKQTRHKLVKILEAGGANINTTAGLYAPNTIIVVPDRIFATVRTE
jgi:hypothetical protein